MTSFIAIDGIITCACGDPWFVGHICRTIRPMREPPSIDVEVHVRDRDGLVDTIEHLATKEDVRRLNQRLDAIFDILEKILHRILHPPPETGPAVSGFITFTDIKEQQE